MNSFSQIMGNQTLLPLIQASTVDDGLNIAEAMHKADIKLVEVVLRTTKSLDIIKAIKEKYPDLLVGAGTVYSEKILDSAMQANVDFIVTPAISAKLLDLLAQTSLPILPGVSNNADIVLTLEHGFEEMKLFPAALSGGVDYLSAISSIFSDVKFCPTGGVNEHNWKHYLELKNVFAVGGSWVSKQEWIKNKAWDKITRACKATR